MSEEQNAKPLVDFDSAYRETQHVVVGEKIIFFSIKTDEDALLPVAIQHGRNEDQVQKADWDCQGKIVVFHSQADADYGSALIKRRRNVIPLSKFDHSGERWGIMGTMDNYPDARWDLTRYAGVWVPDKDVYSNLTRYHGDERKQKIREYCESVLETFNQYLIGDVYGYTVQVYNVRRDDDGEVLTDEDDYRRAEAVGDDSCWGFYGTDTVVEDLTGIVKHYMKEASAAPL